MAPRLIAYLFAGALALTWLDLPEGFTRYAAVIGLILVSAYVDTSIRGRKQRQAPPGNVVSLLGYRKAAGRQSGSAALRERRGMRRVFASPEHSEADELAQLLRTEGMKPIVVTSKPAGTREPTQFEIRLATQEAERAKPLVNWFKVRLGKSSHYSRSQSRGVGPGHGAAAGGGWTCPPRHLPAPPGA